MILDFEILPLFVLQPFVANFKYRHSKLSNPNHAFQTSTELSSELPSIPEPPSTSQPKPSSFELRYSPVSVLVSVSIPWLRHPPPPDASRQQRRCHSWTEDGCEEDQRCGPVVVFALPFPTGLGGGGGGGGGGWGWGRMLTLGSGEEGLQRGCGGFAEGRWGVCRC